MEMWIRLALVSVLATLALAATEKKETKKGDKGEKEDGEYKTPKQKRLEKEFQTYMEIEQKLVDSIKTYIELEHTRLEKLKKLADNSAELKAEYIFNPVNFFKLIKRLVYSDVYNGMKEMTVDKVVAEFKEDLPSEETLRKAAVEVFRWQDKKEAKVKDLANGNLPEDKTQKPLTIDDCFHLGRMAYNDEDYFHSAQWFEEAWERILLKKAATNKEKVPILDYLSFCYYKMGNIQRAFWMTNTQIVEMDPDNSRAKGNLGFYETEMKEFGLKMPESEKDLPEVTYLTVPEIKKRDKEIEKKRAAKEKEEKKDDKKDGKKDEKKDSKKDKKDEKKEKKEDKKEKKDESKKDKKTTKDKKEKSEL